MSRAIQTVEVEGRPALDLFDAGAVYTCPFRVVLGGRLEGLEFDTDAVPLEEIGKADGQKLGLPVGALTMERWEIKIDSKSGALDLEGLRRRRRVPGLWKATFLSAAAGLRCP